MISGPCFKCRADGERNPIGLCNICDQLAHPERKMSKSAGAMPTPTPAEIKAEMEDAEVLWNDLETTRHSDVCRIALHVASRVKAARAEAWEEGYHKKGPLSMGYPVNPYKED